MVRFWKKGRRAFGKTDPKPDRQEILQRLYPEPMPHALVIGPEDGACVCGDWVGAVLSIEGDDANFPSLDAAIADGLFHHGCRHGLEVFELSAVTPETLVEAQISTKHAVTTLERRITERPFRDVGDDPQESSVPVDKAAMREEFTRLYARARQEDTHGPQDAVLETCRSALYLLREADLFGEEQAAVELALRARIRTLIGSDHEV